MGLMPPYKVIIIDDDEMILEFVESALKELFSEDILDLKSFSSSANACKFIKEEEISIILTDIHMPGKSGDLVLNDCKDKKGRSPILILMSGDKSFSMGSSAYMDGARFYLTKPFELDSLKEIFVNCIFELDHWNLFFEKFKK